MEDKDFKLLKEYSEACQRFKESMAVVKKELLKHEIEYHVKDLLLFCEDDGTVVNGYRTKEIILRLKKILEK